MDNQINQPFPPAGNNAPIQNNPENQPIIPYKNAYFDIKDLPEVLYLFQDNKAFRNSIRSIANTIIKGESSLNNLNAALSKLKQHELDNTFPNYILDRFKKDPESTRKQFMKATLHESILAQAVKINTANEYVKSIDTHSILANKLLQTIQPRRPATTKELILKAMDAIYEPKLGKISGNISMTKYIQNKITFDMLDIAFVFQETTEKQEESRRLLATKKEKAKEIKSLNQETPIQVTESTLNKTVFRIIKEVNLKTNSSNRSKTGKPKSSAKDPASNVTKKISHPKSQFKKKPEGKKKISKKHFGKSV